MPFDLDEKYEAMVVSITGKFLGSIDGPEFKETIKEFIEEGHTQVVADLGEAEMMDSSGIGDLISAHTSLRRQGGALRLANLEENIRPIFLMTKLLGNVFESYPTVEAAVESFQTDPPGPPEEKEGAEGIL